MRSHPETPFTFVTDGLESAIDRARQVAGERNVAVNRGTIARQCLELGLLDEIWLDLVPVPLGGGTPFFDQVRTAPALLDSPRIIPGVRVTHLRHQVRNR